MLCEDFFIKILIVIKKLLYTFNNICIYSDIFTIFLTYFYNILLMMLSKILVIFSFLYKNFP